MQATPDLSLVEGFKDNVDFNFYLHLFDELQTASLDVIQHASADPNLFSFVEHCTFFATIVKAEGAASAGEGAALNWMEEATALGLIYCSPSTFAKELNIGIILHRDFRGRGYARRAVQIILRWAFETAEYHRVHAAIIDNVEKDRSISLFTQL
jgi:GNAT superfamily N-acetyltransferase